MVHYKLTYFNARGLCEVSRQLFHLGDIEYEDERLNWQQYLDRKDSLPFGQMPVLTVDGLQIPQSVAIARYLGYAGKTLEEETMTDGFIDLYKDFFTEINDYYFTMVGLKKLNGEEQKVKVLIPARDKFLPLLIKYLEKSQSGYLVDGGITYADLMIIDNMTTLIGWYPEYLDNYPVIQEWRNRVLNFDKLKEYLDKRPKTVT